MPPYNDTRDFAVAAKTLVTASDITAITFKNVGIHTWWLVPAVGAVEPANAFKGVPVVPGEGCEKLVLADSFIGLSGANRIYVFAPNGGRGFFSHA